MKKRFCVFFSLCPSTPVTPHHGHQLLPLLSFPTRHTVPDTLRPSPCSAATVWSTFCCFGLLTTTWVSI